MGNTGTHLGLHLGDSWTLALLRPGDTSDGPGAESDLSSSLSTVSAAQSAPSTGSSPADALAAMGLRPYLVETGSNLYLLRGDTSPAGSTGPAGVPGPSGTDGDGPPRVLPGKGPAGGGATSTTWSRLIASRCDLEVLEFCAAQHLMALAARLEDGTGSRSAPCDTFTVSAEGSGSADFYEAVARAVAEVFGVRPTFLWMPTACAGWALAQPAVQTHLIAGRAVATTVVNTTIVNTSAARPPAGAMVVTARHIDGSIRATVSNAEAAAASPVQSPTTAVSAGPRIRYADTGRARCAVLGAALWGWWRDATRRRQVDELDPAVCRFILVGHERAPSQETASETAPAQRAEEGVPLLDVTPPAAPESLGESAGEGAADFGGRERPSPRWLARAVQVQGDLFGPVPLKVCAVFRWSAAALGVADFLFPMEEVRGRWRGRFSVAVRLDPGGNGGVVSLVRPDSADRTDTPFVLLPGAGSASEGKSRLAPTYAAVRDAFRSLPSPTEYAWTVGPPSESLLLLGEQWRVLPRDFAGPLDLHVLRFSPDATPPTVRVDPASVLAAGPPVERALPPGLRGYTIRLSRRGVEDSGDVRGSGPGGGGAPGAGAESVREVTWSLRTEPSERPVETPPPANEPIAEGATTGTISTNGGQAPPAMTVAKPPAATLAGTILLAPPAYGLLAEFRWDQGGRDVATPYPVGRRTDQPAGRAVPMAVGYRAAEGGPPMASVPTTGRLVLNNLGAQPLFVRLSPGESVRAAATALVVAPGARAEVPVQRRRTVNGRDVARFREVDVVCRVEPIGGDAGEANHLPAAPPLGPRVELSVGTGGRSADLPTLCLPGAGAVHLELPSWTAPGAWRVPVEVAGAAAAELVLGPSGLAGSTGPAGAGVAASVPGDPDGLTATRHAEAVIHAQPVVLLDWFPMPMAALAGELEFRHNRIDREEASALAVPYPFTARIAGLYAVARSLKVDHSAGLAFALPFDLLASDDAQPDPVVEWRWEPSADAPYPMTCELLADEPPAAAPHEVGAVGDGGDGRVAGGQETNGQGENGRHAAGPGVDPPRFATTSLSAAALKANSEHRRPRWLRVRPQAPSGWEQGAWRATLVLAAADGRVLDEVPVSYAVGPLVPRLGVRVGSTIGPDGNPAFELAVRNVNPFRALTVVGLNLSAEVRVKGLKVEEAAAVFDEAEGPGGRVEAGQGRAWTGRLTAGRNRLLRSIRRLPGLSGFATYAGKKARVDLSLQALCEGRSDRPYTYRAQGEVEIL